MNKQTANVGRTSLEEPYRSLRVWVLQMINDVTARGDKGGYTDGYIDACRQFLDRLEQADELDNVIARQYIVE